MRVEEGANVAERILEPEKTAVAVEAIYRLSVEQYYAMANAGILVDGDPVELLEGWLVQKPVKNPPHGISTQSIRDELARVLSLGWFVSDQEAITTLESVPEPDVIIVRGVRRDYRLSHPKGNDLALAVEVSDSTLRTDRMVKRRVYARAGIPVYWIVNLVDRQIEVFSEPKDGSYQKQQIYAETSMIPVVIEQAQIAEVAVRDLLP